jgi:Ca-activated chloride channel family protein
MVYVKHSLMRRGMSQVTFRTPYCLLLLVFIPLLLWPRRQRPALPFPSLRRLDGVGASWKTRLVWLPAGLRILALILFIVALANPVRTLRTIRYGEGLDVILAIDVSTSMLAEDFTVGSGRQNRLQVVKIVVEDFIQKRSDDRIGVVVFGKDPYTLAPLTWDHDWLAQQLRLVETGMVEDGTAIGAAIAASANRLKDSQAKEKVVILLTDGVNNVWRVDPELAAKTASALGIRIYTIGVGSLGPVPYPVTDPFGRTYYADVQIDLDEGLLQSIADTTGGKYYFAANTQELQDIYQEIDQLEQTPLQIPEYHVYAPLYLYFLLGGLGALLLELLLKETCLRRIP